MRGVLFGAVFLFLFSSQGMAGDCLIRLRDQPTGGYNDVRPIRTPEVEVSAAQVEAALAKVNAQIAVEESTPEQLKRREPDGQFKRSYSLFHPPQQKIVGTVLLFHGFSNRPEQMSALAAYLFHSGFNVYNVFLSGQYRVPGNKYWPKLLYRPGYLSKFNGASYSKLFALRVLRAYGNPEGSAFQKFFADKPLEVGGQDQTAWMTDAKARFADLEDLPGPKYVVGLSLGGSIALNLAAELGPAKIQGVVAHAPYLQEHDANRRNQIKVGGPTDRHVITLNNQQVSGASAAAQQLLGDQLFTFEKQESLAQIPTLIIGTESDISADTARSHELHEGLGEFSTTVPHLWFSYPDDLGVGHALTDPRDYPDVFVPADRGGGRNYHHRALYQETANFLGNGKIDENNLVQYGQNPALPEVSDH